jgi:hypothetical protein
MSRRTREPRRVTLDFSGSDLGAEGRYDLSAAVAVGDDLWLGTDEGTCLLRLRRIARDRWAEAVAVPLEELVALPGAEDDEIDVEGVDVEGGWLWVTGSHSAVRKKPDDELPPPKRLRRLARTSRAGNRHLLARLPLVPGADGRGALVREAAGPDGETRRAARLPGTRKGDDLTRALRDDPHVGPFLDVPGKDNGFDVEGLAVHGDRVWLGLRGPVLRGHAVLLALHPGRDGDDPQALKLRRCGPRGRRYEKFFLDLAGLGVRELCAHGDDLLVLAGPTMVLDGRCAVFRWRDARHARGDALVPRDALAVVLELPYGHGDDEGVEHPEGLALVDDDGAKALLVVHDAPAASRTRGEAVHADLYALD